LLLKPQFRLVKPVTFDSSPSIFETKWSPKIQRRRQGQRSFKVEGLASSGLLQPEDLPPFFGDGFTKDCPGLP
jgi:hypothetical protein